MLAYVVAGVLYAIAGVLLAGVSGSIDPAFGSAYLLAPIAAVVIAGASLGGGLASATSTWLAALALTLLTQMLVIMGLSAAMQYVVFGAAIIAGMVVSGDRRRRSARPRAADRGKTRLQPRRSQAGARRPGELTLPDREETQTMHRRKESQMRRKHQQLTVLMLAAAAVIGRS